MPKVSQDNRTKKWRLKLSLNKKQIMFSFGSNKREALKLERRINSILDDSIQRLHLEKLIDNGKAEGVSNKELIQRILVNPDVSKAVTQEEKIEPEKLLESIDKFIAKKYEAFKTDSISNATFENYKNSLKKLKEFVEYKNLSFVDDFNEEVGNEFAFFLKDTKKLSNGSVSSYFNQCRVYFQWLIKSNLTALKNNPLPKKKVIKRKLNFTINDFFSLIDYMESKNPNERLIQFLQFALKTGWRISEITGINLETDVDWENEVVLRSGKTDKIKKPYQLINGSIAHLREWKARNVSNYAFSLKNGHKADKSRLGKNIKKYCLEAGLKAHILVHNLRRLFITTQMEQGANSNDIATYLGVSIRMVEQVYNATKQEDSATRLGKFSTIFQKEKQ
ncbi:MAG: hypothetical protein DWQ06_02330 [Calditrichaeota bacterium]|nr:MAG: hypothetical protein DWQ06_02330 [Calditrichota bacterium]